MRPEDHPPTTSEPRSVAGIDEKALVEFALNQAESALRRMQPTPATERLSARVDAFRRIVSAWNIRPPTVEQVRLLLERIGEVREMARTGTPTVRVRRTA